MRATRGELARAYDREGCGRGRLPDITATSDNRATTIEMAAHAAEELAIPYTVGGGFRDLAGMRTMVAAGADKVSLNSAAVRDPSLISQAAAAFGSQCRGRGDRCQARGAARRAGRR